MTWHRAQENGEFQESTRGDVGAGTAKMGCTKWDLHQCKRWCANIGWNFNRLFAQLSDNLSKAARVTTQTFSFWKEIATKHEHLGGTVLELSGGQEVVYVLLLPMFL